MSIDEGDCLWGQIDFRGLFESPPPVGAQRIWRYDTADEHDGLALATILEAGGYWANASEYDAVFSTCPPSAVGSLLDVMRERLAAAVKRTGFMLEHHPTEGKVAS